MNTPMSTIIALLRQTLGFTSESVSTSIMEANVAAQMRNHGLKDPADYLALLRTAPDALTQLIDMTVVPETWFFRDNEPFRFVREWIRRNGLHADHQPAVRALSIPCSTGEEPYSLAMTLRLAGVALNRIQIDAMDISRRALEHARCGIYGRHSFREQNSEEYQSFFTPDGPVWNVDNDIMATVCFRQENVLDICSHIQEDGIYQIILCRNLLIYLHEDARQRLLSTLDRMLVPGGLIILGHAETPSMMLPGYRSVAHARSFAVQKPETAPPPCAVPTPVPPRAVKRAWEPPHRVAVPARCTAREVEQRLTEIERRVNNREWDAAETACRALLDGEITCARGWFWLGSIAIERRRADEAIDHLSRALYLEPYFKDALRRMSVAQRLAGRERRAQHYGRLSESGVST